MIEIVNDIEITKSGEYRAKVFVDGWEQMFNINTQTFDDDELDDFVDDVMIELREQRDFIFYEEDRNGNKRFTNLKYYSNEVWRELLRDDHRHVNLFFELWRFY